VAEREDWKLDSKSIAKLGMHRDGPLVGSENVF
jgi:hypothetical protein